MSKGEWKSSFRDVSIALASLGIAVATIVYAIQSTAEERNAKLVEIGVSVLRVDPQKNPQVASARKWALDLIDKNAGGVKFSPEDRAELLQRPLGFDATDSGYGSDLGYGYTRGNFSSHGGFGDPGPGAQKNPSPHSN